MRWENGRRLPGGLQSPLARRARPSSTVSVSRYRGGIAVLPEPSNDVNWRPLGQRAIGADHLKPIEAWFAGGIDKPRCSNGLHVRDSESQLYAAAAAFANSVIPRATAW